jgi:7-carboxy-7-deazaguanine synthase
MANSTPPESTPGNWAHLHEARRHQPEVLARLMAEYEYQLKFVVREPGDLIEIEKLVGELNASRDRVLLMPEGTTREAVQERSLWLAEVAKSSGFRLTPRLHIDLWGSRRGV